MAAACIERIELNGAELEYVRLPARRRDAPALVFLHEGLGSTALWRDVPQKIAAATGCEAIVYSRSGNGFSSPAKLPRSPQYMHDEALIVLPALLRKLDVRDALLIGHSDGASIALVFAAEHPSAVRGLVLEAPHLFVERLSTDSIAAIRRTYETTDLRERMQRHHADADATFYGWNDVWLSPGFARWNLEAYVARLRAPALAIQGVDDEYGTLAQLEALSAGSPSAVDRIVLVRCGHAPHRDRSAFTLAAITGWIEERLG